MSDVVIVVPARYGSRRLPGKPLRDVGGAPLIVRVVERLEALAPIPILVATDHEGIARAVDALGVTACMTPSDCPTGMDRVAAAVAGRDEPLIVNVQGDEPLVDPEAVARLMGEMRNDPTVEMGTLAAPIRDARVYASEHTVKVVVDSSHNALYFSRRPIPWTPRDEVPPEAFQHIGVYAYRREALRRLSLRGPVALERHERLEQLRALYLGMRIRVFQVEGTWIGVDTEADLEGVRRLFRARAASEPGAPVSGAT